MDNNKKYTKFNIVLFLFFILGITSILFIKNIDAFDYWWHVKAGEYIVTTHSIPFTDVFSWIGSESGFYWHSHEWLSEVVIYLFSCLGTYGGYIFTILALGILVGLLYLLNVRNYFKNIRFSILWVIIGLIILPPVVTARPHMISFILLALTIYLLVDLRENEKSKKIWFMPLISLLWVNFHGGSSNLPYVLCFMFIITGLFNFKIGKIKGTKLSKIQLKKYFIVAILSIMALVINPHGFDMITYPYVNMGDSYMLSIINEWRCPDLKNLSDMPIFLEMALLCGILFIFNDEVDFTDFGLIGGFIYLTLKSVRFSVLLYIVATFIIFKYIKPCKDEKIVKQLSLPLGIFGVMFMIFYFTMIGTLGNEPMKTPVSQEIIEVLQKENPTRLYNEYDIGGYLIYNDIKVFVDGRADMYSAGGNIKDAINLSMMTDNPNEIIKKYNFDMFVIYKGYPLDYYLALDDNYIKIADDGEFVIYKSNNQ